MKLVMTQATRNIRRLEAKAKKTGKPMPILEPETHSRITNRNRKRTK